LRSQRDEALGGEENDARIARWLAVRQRRRITGGIVELLPDFLAGLFVEGHDRRSLGSDVDEHVVAYHDGRAGTAERQGRRLVFLFAIDLPVDLAVGGVETRQDAGDAEGVDLAVGD